MASASPKRSFALDDSSLIAPEDSSIVHGLLLWIPVAFCWRNTDITLRHPKRHIFHFHDVRCHRSMLIGARQCVQNIVVWFWSLLWSVCKPAPLQWTLSRQVNTVAGFVEGLAHSRRSCMQSESRKSPSKSLDDNKLIVVYINYVAVTVNDRTGAGILRVSVFPLCWTPLYTSLRSHCLKYWNRKGLFKVVVIKIDSIHSQVPRHFFGVLDTCFFI